MKLDKQASDVLKTQIDDFGEFEKTLDHLADIKKSLNSITNKGLVRNLEQIFIYEENEDYFKIVHESGKINICYESVKKRNKDCEPFKKAMEDI